MNPTDRESSETPIWDEFCESQRLVRNLLKPHWLLFFRERQLIQRASTEQRVRFGFSNQPQQQMKNVRWITNKIPYLLSFWLRIAPRATVISIFKIICWSFFMYLEGSSSTIFNESYIQWIMKIEFAFWNPLISDAHKYELQDPQNRSMRFTNSICEIHKNGDRRFTSHWKIFWLELFASPAAVWHGVTENHRGGFPICGIHKSDLWDSHHVKYLECKINTSNHRGHQVPRWS